MIKMCVFDVDGTLYDFYNHCILDSTIQALKQLQSNGIKIAVATGRCHYGLGKALNDLNFDYILAVNGSVIVNHENTVLFRNDISSKDVMELNEFCHKYSAGLIWKFIDHMYIYQHVEKIDWYEGQINSDIGLTPFIDCPSQDRHLKDAPQSASVHADPKLIKETFGNSDTLEFLQYSSDGYDVVSKGMDKGKGILKLLEITDISSDEVLVFGDNYNDLPMFDVIPNRVAMGNAVDEIKAFSTYVTSDCAHDGIYNACKYFNLI